MKEILLNAVRQHATGHIAKHKANIEVYLNSSVGIGEHPNIIEVIENELAMIGKYQEQLDILNKYFTTSIEYSQLLGKPNSTSTVNE